MGQLDPTPPTYEELTEAAFLAETLLPYLTVDDSGRVCPPMGHTIYTMFRRWRKSGEDDLRKFQFVDWQRVVKQTVGVLVADATRRYRAP